MAPGEWQRSFSASPSRSVKTGGKEQESPGAVSSGGQAPIDSEVIHEMGTETGLDGLDESIIDEAISDSSIMAEAHDGREWGMTMMDRLDEDIRDSFDQSLREKNTSTDFWNYAAANKEDEAFIKDNVTSMGHEELERQREYREYARLAAWELPLLSSRSSSLRRMVLY